jgi:hypothetical protein
MQVHGHGLRGEGTATPKQVKPSEKVRFEADKDTG